MMRRDAKVTLAYSGLAELKAALDPRQRFVDEITPIGRSMAEVSRGEPLLSSAGLTAPLTGGFTQPSCPRKGCGRVAAIGDIARAFGAMDRVFTGKLAADNGTSRAPGRSSICSNLVAKMRGTNRSDRVTARLRASLVPLPNGGPRMPNSARTRSACFWARRQKSSNGCLGPALLPGGAEKWRRARGRTLN
ncbi:hypothetical protein ACVWWK_003136 [Bradyrhizobium sp. LB9.1b]